MNLKKKIRICIYVIAALCICIFLFVFFKAFKVDNCQQSNDISPLYDNLNKKRYRSEGVFLFDTLNLNINNGLELKKLFSILKNQRTLVYYVSEKHCNTCIDLEINLLKQFTEKYKPVNLVILQNLLSEDKRAALIFMDRTALNCQMFIIDRLNLEAVNTDIPFVFFVDELGYTRFVFFLLKENLVPFTEYLDFIGQRFFNANKL